MNYWILDNAWQWSIWRHLNQNQTSRRIAQQSLEWSKQPPENRANWRRRRWYFSKRKHTKKFAIDATWMIDLHLQRHEKGTIRSDIHIRAWYKPGSNRRMITLLTSRLRLKMIDRRKMSLIYLFISLSRWGIQINHFHRCYMRIARKMICIAYFTWIDQWIRWWSFNRRRHIDRFGIDSSWSYFVSRWCT